MLQDFTTEGRFCLWGAKLLLSHRFAGKLTLPIHKDLYDANNDTLTWSVSSPQGINGEVIVEIAD